MRVKRLFPLRAFLLRIHKSCLAILAILFCSCAWATDSNDLVVSMKILPLLENRLHGTAVVAVLYNPASAESIADANNIKNALEHGMGTLIEVTLVPKLVSISELNQMTGSKIAFLAKEIPPDNFDAISSAAASSGILTISTDLRCVNANKCVLGVVFAPTVKIYYSRTAAEASHISFTPVFLMLIKRL